jgi:16S rRNA (guanine966-N2)-methyltransferase
MRIVAGRFRGRPLIAPRGMNTRPTIDRAREALFQILGPLDDLTAVDFYAGTGALGFEALSRGARRVALVEIDRDALEAIRRNIEKLGVTEETTVITRPVGRCRSDLERLKPIDLVLSDPPWAIASEAAVLVAKTVRGLLAPGARLVLGHPTQAPVTLPEALGYECVDSRRYGGSGLSFFEPRDFDLQPEGPSGQMEAGS